MHLFLIALWLAAVDPARWQFVSGSDDLAAFVDQASVRHDAERVVFQEKLLFSHPKSGAEEFQSEIEANCIDHSFTMRKTTAFKGGKLFATRQSEEVEHAVPGTPRFLSIMAACDPGVGRIGGDPYAIARQFFAEPPYRPAGADRGFRSAERLLAGAVAIGGGPDKYIASAFSPARVEKCGQGDFCTYRRDYPLSLGRRTAVRVTFTAGGMSSDPASCRSRPDPFRCPIYADASMSGEERAPRCVRVAPILEAARAAGWREYDRHNPPDPATTAYRWGDDPDLYLFVHPLADVRCLKVFLIMRIARVHPQLRD